MLTAAALADLDKRLPLELTPTQQALVPHYTKRTCDPFVNFLQFCDEVLGIKPTQP